MANLQFVRWFEDIRLSDIPSVGGKNAGLGEMFQAFSGKKIRVPNGFAITTDAYRHFMKHNHIEVGKETREAILQGELPPDLGQSIVEAYRKLSEGELEPLAVAVRSSATAEDLSTASFAGAQETFLNVTGEKALLEACKGCFASLFKERAISYRRDQGIHDPGLALSIGVQRMVRSDSGSSGVIFTIDTETGFRDVVLISASYGLGENIVNGSVVPDEFYVFKPTLALGYRPIIQKILGGVQDRFSVTDDELLTLARWACLIEEHFGRPMDIEWAKDGVTGELFIVQARPETVQAGKSKTVLQTYHLKKKGKILVEGRRVGERIGSGLVRVIETARDFEKLQPGEVLVTHQTDPDWEPVMKRAAAIVTQSGGRTCHAAIVARELGIPAVVGAKNAMSLLKTGTPVTVCAAEGEIGFIYEGLLPFEVLEVSLAQLPRPKTKVMMIVGNPHEAFRCSFIPNDGVGLVREEFIISTAIKIHPMALVNYQMLEDLDAKREIESLTTGYSDKSQYFVDHLAQGVAMIAAAFYPNDVIVRFSDFKTHEYANLIGGKPFEPHEENPMLGFRGASRYYDDRFRPAFALEVAAMKKVREEMGLTNVKLMIPFCRTVEEGKKVIHEIERLGLKQGENGLEIYVMCEIPSNVILASEFADIFDGFSIGSNDLTQLALGVDRDSEIVAHLFDEQNQAVKSLIQQVVEVAHKKGKKIGICGQAPTDYPEFTQFLVGLGIDSISLNPDAVLKTRFIIDEAEKKGEKKHGNKTISK